MKTNLLSSISRIKYSIPNSISKFFNSDPNFALKEKSKGKRIDLSNYLIHFTKSQPDNDPDESYVNLKSILTQQNIIGNNGDIRGGFNCVCFTEAPIDCLKLSNGIVCFNGETKYSNYGIMISKLDVYNLGGRPAIYTDNEHFDLLPDELKFRYVRFEPLKKIKGTDCSIDFTWEREWRLLGSLDISNISYEIIVPTKSIGEKLKIEAENESFSLFVNCSNQSVPLIDYDELCNDVCETHSSECPQPIFIERDCIICMDETC